jgi:hypothetical protein
MADVATIRLFSDAVVKTVFEAILKNRSAIFKELVASVGKNADDPTDRKQVEEAVSRLKEADLIRERAASIEDFNSYYVTSGGLGAERELRLVDDPKTAHPW